MTYYVSSKYEPRYLGIGTSIFVRDGGTSFGRNKIIDCFTRRKIVGIAWRKTYVLRNRRAYIAARRGNGPARTAPGRFFVSG